MVIITDANILRLRETPEEEIFLHLDLYCEAQWENFSQEKKEAMVKLLEILAEEIGL